MRADRLMSLVLLLQARGRTTAASLARELGVSVRTIYRDLEGLSAAGVPVLAESGPHGGCELVAGYRFPLRGLRPEEAEALLILGIPDALRDPGLAASRPPDGALVHLDMPRWFRGQEQVPQLGTVAEALRQRRRLELRYRRGRDGPDTPERPPRAVHPLGLVNKAGAWYLVALTEPGARPAVFRAARITAARVLAEPAARLPGFRLAEFWAGWSQEFAATRPKLPVRLRASPAALAIFPEVFGDDVSPALAAALPPDQQGWRELTLSFEHEHAAAHRLAGFGAQVEVLAPDQVRTLLITTARDLLRRYPPAATPGP